jgi:hypothetical protein
MNFSVKVNDNIHMSLGVGAKLDSVDKYKTRLAI